LLLSFGAASLCPKTRQNAEDDIREAVFRWQINPPFHHAEAKVYFLAVSQKGDDPSEEFLNRFATDEFSVRKRSDCNVHANKSVVDKKTGERGIMLRVGKIHRASDTEATVVAEYDAEGQNAMVYTCTLRNEDGKWRIVRAVRGARDELLLANQTLQWTAGLRCVQSEALGPPPLS
jgi:hypothetical protein